jgi:predicted TIM-barrel fold metal-dependent hydrolase
MGPSTPSFLSTTRGIDIHHHFLPPFFVEALSTSGNPAAAKAKALAWSPEKSIAMMDESGIKTAIISLSLPDVSFIGAENPADLARKSNEYAARMIADYPGRFGAFASLPFLDPQTMMVEVEYALDILKLDGIVLLSNVRGCYLGDMIFNPLLAELNHRRTVVFLHPNQPPNPGFNDFVEFPHEVTRALASLTESGCIERYPRIRYILAYGGGTIPFIAARVTIVGMDVSGSLLKTMVSYIKRARTMQRMNYDLTASTDPFAWRALSGHTKTTRILMGSNYPWSSKAAFARQQAELRATTDLDHQGIESIEWSNSLKLFPRFT